MPTKSAGTKKSLPASRSGKSEEIKEVIQIPDLEETEVAAPIAEEEETPIGEESDLLVEEITLDEEELNPFGDKWEE